MRAKYLGLDLPSPIIVSSSPYTSNVKSVEQCAASGAGAVVLKSIFEEQILHHAAALDTVSDSAYGDAEVYLQRYLGEDYKAGFLRLVQEARSKTELPVIATSIAWSIKAIGSNTLRRWPMPVLPRWSLIFSSNLRTFMPRLANWS